MNRCEICGLKPENARDAGRNFDTHHILFQCSADNYGRVDDGRRGRNDLSNLVILCKDDHQRVHKGELWIRGWKETSRGRVLDWGQSVEVRVNSGRKRMLGKIILTEDLVNKLRLYWEEGVQLGNWNQIINRLRWKHKIGTTVKTFRKIYENQE